MLMFMQTFFKLTQSSFNAPYLRNHMPVIDKYRKAVGNLAKCIFCLHQVSERHSSGKHARHQKQERQDIHAFHIRVFPDIEIRTVPDETSVVDSRSSEKLSKSRFERIPDPYFMVLAIDKDLAKHGFYLLGIILHDRKFTADNPGD